MSKSRMNTANATLNVPAEGLTPDFTSETLPLEIIGGENNHKNLKILHLEDLKSDDTLINKVLKKAFVGFEKLVVDTKDKFITALKEFPPDIILADHSLASFNSHEALKTLHQTGVHIPFILVNAAVTNDFVVDVIKRGADDYILKTKLNRLPAAIHNALERFQVERERRAFFEEVTHNERKFDGMVILSAEGKPLYVSPAVKKIIGYSQEEAFSLDLISLAHPDDTSILAGLVAEAMANPGVPTKEQTTRMRHKDGSWRWVEGSITNLLNDPAIRGIVDNFRDVTDKKLADDKIIHLNRMYAFTSQINQALVRAEDEKNIFKEACRIAIGIGEVDSAWIGMIDFNNRKMNLVEECGLHKEDAEKLKDFSYSSNGPLNYVLSRDTYYVCNNIQKDLGLQKWKLLASARGYNSCMIIPIRKRGIITGTFNLYAREVNFFDAGEIALLTEATSNISFALDIFEKEKLKLQADDNLKHNELRLKQAQSIAHLGSWELDFSTGVSIWSAEMLKIYGLPPTRGKQSGASLAAFIHPEDYDYVTDLNREAISERKNSAFFHRIVLRNGAIRHIYSQAHIELDAEGKPTGMYGVAHDVTEMKETESALHESALHLQAIFENTSEGFILIDLDGIINLFNNKAREIFFLNVGKQFTTGASIFDFVGNSTTESLYKAAIPKVLSGEDLQFDLSFERKNDEIVWFGFNITRVYRGGVITGFSITVKDITQRKEAENTLRQSEMRYRQIVETAQEGIWLMNENNQTTFVNKKMCEILEYSEEEMLGKDNFYFVDEAGKKEASASMETRKKDTGGNMNLRYITQSGKEIWTSVSTNPIFDDAGNYKGALRMISDITEKRNLEKLLDKTNKLAKIGSYEVDTKKNTLYWSPVTKQIHEVEDDFVPDLKTALGFYKEGANRELIIQATDNLKYKNIPYDLEVQIVTAKGNDCWIRIIGNAEFINGKCIKRYGSFQDIDKIKKAELKTLQLFAEKNVILESIGDAFFAVDSNWTVTYWNKEAEKVLSVTKHQIIGKNLWEIFSDSTESESYKKYHDAINNNRVLNFNDYYPVLGKWFAISAYPSGNGLSVYIKDITEQRKVEDEREKIAADLIRRNKDLEQFSYIISHNLRAPVANIMGLSYTLQKEGIMDTVRQKAMAGLASSVNKLDEVIKDLNVILKIRQELNEHIQMVDFTQLVNSIRANNESITLTEKTTILCDFSGVNEMPAIKSYMYSIFYNLISNSLKYRQPDTPPVIEIKSQRIDDKIVLSYRDNGLGIDLQKRGGEVFGLYKRFHTARAEGKGMGLYMVKTQVESLGGNISVSSEVNKGTEFTIELPLKSYYNND